MSIAAMVTKIFLLRHGETEWSISGRHTSSTDLPLTANGERRASQLRMRLEGIEFSHVITSPLQRARRTCELAGFGASAQIVADLQEWNYGEYEGRTTADIQEKRPRWNVFQDGCPQGESVERVTQRADRVLADLRSLAGMVAIFSHGHFLRALAARWLGLPVRDGRLFALDTGSISVLGFEHAETAVPVLSLWNAGATLIPFSGETAAAHPWRHQRPERDPGRETACSGLLTASGSTRTTLFSIGPKSLP